MTEDQRGGTFEMVETLRARVHTFESTMATNQIKTELASQKITELEMTRTDHEMRLREGERALATHLTTGHPQILEALTELGREIRDMRQEMKLSIERIYQRIETDTVSQAEWKQHILQEVTKDEFRPVKTIVYGMVGLILTSVLLAIIGLVLMRAAAN